MDLDEERIGMVLVRASELRSKLTNCIRKASLPCEGGQSLDQSGGKDCEDDPSPVGGNEGDEDAETLLTICDAFESLESQLAALQALQHQQQYEREAVISEIEYSRKMLLKKLDEYKGEHHLDVIQEASSFASVKVEHNNELLLPPYPSHATHSLVLDSANLPHFSYGKKLGQNGYNNGNLVNEAKNKRLEEPERKQPHTILSRSYRGLKFLVGSLAKTVATVVAVASILSLAGFEAKVTKRNSDNKVLGLLQLPNMDEEKLAKSDCPPGKIAVLEDGEIRCLVKERVEVPFDFVASKPDVDYGCG